MPVVHFVSYCDTSAPQRVALEENPVSLAHHQAVPWPFRGTTWLRAAESSRGQWGRKMNGIRTFLTPPPLQTHWDMLQHLFHTKAAHCFPSETLLCPAGIHPLPTPRQNPLSPLPQLTEGKWGMREWLLPLPALPYKHLTPGESAACGAFRQTLPDVRQPHPNPTTPPGHLPPVLTVFSAAF